MIKTILLSMCLAASLLSLDARAQDVRRYTDGPVTEVAYIQVDTAVRLKVEQNQLISIIG